MNLYERLGNIGMSETPQPVATSGSASDQPGPAGALATSSGVPGISRRTFIAPPLGGAASLVTSGARASINPPIGTDSIFRIHPGIGIARMGNADPEQFFIGPEVPGYGPSGDAPGTQVPPYKASAFIKPQAAR